GFPCTFIVDLVDTVAPSITCPPSQSVSVDANCDWTVFAFDTLAIAGDNCDTSVVITQSPAVGTFFTGVGTTIPITLTVSDNDANSDDCTFSVILADNTPPTAVCNNPNAIIGGTGTAIVTQADIDGGSFDNCMVQSIVVTGPMSFTCQDVGNAFTTLTITDAEGLVDSCVATINIVDTIGPIPICTPTTVALDATGTATITAADVENGSVDNCGGIDSVGLSQSVFNCTDVGQNPITVFVYDESGNFSPCTAVVTVTDPLGVGAPTPTITLSQPDTLCASPAATYQWTIGGSNIPGATSNCFIASNNGCYTVIATAANGCSGESNEICITALDIEDALGGGISIFPNPNNGTFHVMPNEPILEAVDVEVRDVAGRLVYFKSLAELKQKFLVSMQDLPKGVYLIRLTSENARSVKKLIIE
ncbi:MAG: T9SS type A sorting domain-containing protein, partial [Bacteroidota bacterium]